MQFHDFLGQVQNRAQMPSIEDALKATRATLSTLAERLGGEEPRHLAAQLPVELKNFLEGPSSGMGERFDSDEFLHRISEKEGIDLPVAVYHTRVVLEVLGEAVSPGEMSDVKSQLPKDYQRLFEGSRGRMPNA